MHARKREEGRESARARTWVKEGWGRERVHGRRAGEVECVHFWQNPSNEKMKSVCVWIVVEAALQHRCSQRRSSGAPALFQRQRRSSAAGGALEGRCSGAAAPLERRCSTTGTALHRCWSGAAAEHLFSGADTSIHVSPQATWHLISALRAMCRCVTHAADTHLSLGYVWIRNRGLLVTQMPSKMD